jgi:hypothetical protein
MASSFRRAHVTHRLAVDDELRDIVGLGLEQQRVHVNVGLLPRPGRLHGGGPRDLAAIGRDVRVQRHVLRLERRHPKAPVRE